MARKRRPPTQDELFRLDYVIDGVLCPDGTQAAFVRAQHTGKGSDARRVLSIWLVASDGSSPPRRLTRGAGSDYHPRFSPDGRTLYFLSTRSKLPQIHAIPLDGGEAQTITSDKQGAGPFEVAANGRFLAFAAPTRPTTQRGADDHVRISRTWYRFDPVPGYLQDVEHALFTVRPGARPRQLCTSGGLITALAIAADSRSIAFARTGRPEQEFMQSDLCVMPANGRGQPRVLQAGVALEQLAWRDADTLCYQGSGNGLASQGALLCCDVASGRTTNRTTATDINIGTRLQLHLPVAIASRLQVADDGASAFATTTVGGEANVAHIRLQGKRAVTAIAAGARVCHLFDQRAGQLLIASQHPNSPPELHVINVDGSNERVLTDHNRDWKTHAQLPDVTRLELRAGRGVQLEGWVLTPSHVRAPFRTLLVIHGGPHAGYGCSFGVDFQEMVSAGYAVAYMNPRGSTGYGEDFVRAILGRWGDLELSDFNKFLDELVARGIADPERLGVTGISGGGHLSAWLITHSQRFRAAVAEQGVYSMLSMWGTSDAGKALIELEMGGTPRAIPMTYWERSPVAHAHRCRTPTLLMQGENDVRCPLEQAEQMFTALRVHGCEAELVRLASCNHGAQLGGRPALSRYRLQVLLDWFDRHLA